MRCRALVVAALLATTAACTGDDDDDAATPTSTTGPTSTAGTASTASSTGPVADPARDALEELVGWMADPSRADPGAFTDTFLAQVPIEQVRQVLTDLGIGEWEVVAAESVAPGAVAARLEGPGPVISVQLHVDDAGVIDSLLFQPAELADPPADLAALVERLQAMAPIAGFLRADVTADGACTPVAELTADALMPIGSVFKLYVLGAVATAIEAGELGWDDPVEVRDELDSLPSGVTQDEPDGSTLPVRELATRMIAISDNTATDHLIALVGRDRVEDALATLGHSDPAATTPMLTTREMFVVKTDPELLAGYEAADVAGRRALLDGTVASAPLPSVDDFPTAPTAVTTVEWFASPADACRALVHLDDMAERQGLEPLRDVLSENPGTTANGARFERVLFKGGSEPGVLFGAWLATRADGSRVVVAGGVVDEAAPVDPQALQLLELGLVLA